VKESVRLLESQSQVTPAALEARLTKLIKDLMTRVKNTEEAVGLIMETITAVSNHHMKLSTRQSTLEHVMLQYLSNKVWVDAGINATIATVEISTNTQWLAPVAIVERRDTEIDVGINDQSVPVSLNPIQKTQQAQVSNVPRLQCICPHPGSQSFGTEPTSCIPSQISLSPPDWH